MKYVIDEEELIKFVQSHYFSSDKNMAKDIAKDFLKPKQPVEEIASGKLLLDSESVDILQGNLLRSPENWFHPKYKGKQVKILIMEAP